MSLFLIAIMKMLLNLNFYFGIFLVIESTLRSVGTQILPCFIFFKSCIIFRSAKMPQQVATISMPTIKMEIAELLRNILGVPRLFIQAGGGVIVYKMIMKKYRKPTVAIIATMTHLVL